MLLSRDVFQGMLSRAVAYLGLCFPCFLYTDSKPVAVNRIVESLFVPLSHPLPYVADLRV